MNETPEIGENSKLANPNKTISRRSSVVSISSSGKSSVSGSQQFNNDEVDEGMQFEESSKGKVKGSVSRQYFTAGAHWSILSLIGFSFIFVQVLASGADYWVSEWYDKCLILSL